MLYYSGLINRIGDVDHGDTVTDYLPAERDRGITIQSAAVTFNWAGHKVNLIDTPGHADFTFEVIRSIRVLDGAVTILDGVAGVEAQTEKVWRQANESSIPRIVFVNKMDRPGAGFGRTVREVVAKLNTKVGIVNLPYFAGSEGADFAGVVDVVDQKLIQWKENSDGKEVSVTDYADLEERLQQEVVAARTALVETLCEMDEALVEEYLELEDYVAIPASSIRRALRKATLERSIVPVLCGASFRNIGVQPLLEAIVSYLPSPAERPPPTAVSKTQLDTKGKKKIKAKTAQMAAGEAEEAYEIDPDSKHIACALAFKVTNDPIRGILVFVRVYAGRLQQNAVVLNTSNGQKERISRLLQMQADKSVEVPEVEAGNIAVIMGSKEIRTGDTIVAHGSKKDGTNHLSTKEKTLQLNPIQVPPPVFFASIEPQTLADKRGMDEALDILLREDPSLQLTFDQDSSQTLISGMGELHLDIAKDRLINSLKAKIEMGRIQVSYKETIQSPSVEVEKAVSLEDSGSSASVKVSVSPVFEDDEVDATELLDTENNHLSYPETVEHKFISRADIIHAIRIGAVPAVAKGGKLARLPLHSVHINVSSVEIPDDVLDASAVSTAVRLAAEEALESIAKTDFALMEPVMDVRVILNEEDIGQVVNDMSGNRRGNIVSLGEDDSHIANSEADTYFKKLAEEVYVPKDYTMYLSKHESRTTSQQSIVHARVALAMMRGYLPTLRSLTQGRGTYLLDFYRYERVTPDRADEILNEI
ncbi:ribosome-releasing factor 2, mitochondrial [Trichomonascus vanleenenianus]|uniref:mitochondrial elongation factor MEF2 n=1 Tax=Trichomonascus vanleenenianus TaxID=2268995 RepID=UPI003ECA5A8B